MMENHQDEHHQERQEEELTPFVTNRWSRLFVQPLLVTLSVTSLMAGVTLISRLFETSIPWMSLTWLYLFACVESLLTSRWLAHRDQRQVDSMAYRAAELVFIAVVVRLFTWALGNSWPSIDLLPNYLRYPIDLIDDAFFIVGLILTLVAWSKTNSMGELFSELAVDRAEVSYYTQPTGRRSTANRPVSSDRGQLVTKLFQQWIGGGFVLVVCIAIATIDFSEFTRSLKFSAIRHLVVSPEAPSIMVIYFMSGLLLLSQARLAAMNARWLIGGTFRRNNVERSWNRLSLWLILIVAMAAAFLPLGSTFAIGPIVSAIVQAILTLFGLIVSAFLALLSLVFPRTTPPEPSQPSTNLVPPAPPPPAPHPAAANDIMGAIFSSMFWAVAIVVTFMALSFFLRDRGIRIDAKLLTQMRTAVVRWFRSLWLGFSMRWKSARKRVRLPKRAKLKLDRPEKESPWRFLRVSALSPRQQLRYFYLSIVRRAGASGVERKVSETPLEFAQDLKEGWPDDEERVDAVTQAFVKARYSRQVVRKEDVNPVRRQWKRLKSNVRRRRFRESGSRKNNEG